MKRYTRSELRNLETIEQAWDGAELKIDADEYRVWLNPRENAPYDGDYTVEMLDPISGKWESENYYINE